MNKTATVYNSIEKLRAAWLEWEFTVWRISVVAVSATRYLATSLPDYDRFCRSGTTEAEAASALAATLIAAGYPPKEKE